MFSVVIPYYKKLQYIERCLDSVLNQTFKEFEIVLVDDGSEDELKELISKKYLNKVKIISQKNQGVSAARNTGIVNSSKQYIAFLDADDYWSPFYLEKNAEIINKENSVQMIGSHYSSFKENVEQQDLTLTYFPIKNYFKIGIPNTMFFTSATIVNNNFFKNNKGFNPSLKYGEDLDIWFRAILEGGKIFFIDNTLVYYSVEDLFQATRKKANLADTISGQAFDLYSKFLHRKDFSVFLSKYLYINLARSYYSLENHKTASNVLKKIPNKFFLAQLYFQMPFTLGKFLFKKDSVKKMGRKYMKFLFLKIYN